MSRKNSDRDGVPSWEDLEAEYPHATQSQIWNMRADMISGGALGCDPRDPLNEGYEEFYTREAEVEAKRAFARRQKEQEADEKIKARMFGGGVRLIADMIFRTGGGRYNQQQSMELAQNHQKALKGKKIAGT